MSLSRKKLASTYPRAILRDAGLVNAFLDRADLRGMDLSGCNLTGASLRGADLTEANMSDAILIKADFSRACLYRANFEGAIMDASDLCMSYAKATTFKDASMQYCALRGVTYKDCYFWGTNLTGSDFRGAFMLGTVFDGADLSRARNMHHALFYWYRYPHKDYGPVYEPREGWVKLGRSTIPGYSFQENAGPGRILHE